MSARKSDNPQVDESDPYEAVYHCYEPHRAGLPSKIGVYAKELWHRREFAAEMSKAGMRGANSMTFFGQAWLVINPLLLAFVYYLMVNVFQGDKAGGFQRFTHITGGIFVFYFFQGAVAAGASSVTGAGKLLLNTAFPRLLLPLAALRTGFFRFLPTIPVYLVFHLIAGNPITFATFTAAPIFLLLIALFSAGLASIFATLQVYFRDTQAFLPYVMRIWLYMSPVIFTVEQIRSHHLTRTFSQFNPLYSLIGGYMEALQQGMFPPLTMWLQAIAWAVGAAVIGFLFFMSRERDFTVRL